MRNDQSTEDNTSDWHSFDPEEDMFLSETET
jgi:hypothetical protein